MTPLTCTVKELLLEETLVHSKLTQSRSLDFPDSFLVYLLPPPLPPPQLREALCCTHEDEA